MLISAIGPSELTIIICCAVAAALVIAAIIVAVVSGSKSKKAGGGLPPQSSDAPQDAIIPDNEESVPAAVLPELLPCIGFRETEASRRDLYTHLLETCDALPPEKPALRWAALLHDIGKPHPPEAESGRKPEAGDEKTSAEIAASVMRRLKFPNAETETVRFLVESGAIRYDSSWSDGAVRRFAAAVPGKLRDDWFALRRAEVLADEAPSADPTVLCEFRGRLQKCEAENPPLSVKDLAVNGNDLVAAGFPKTKLIGDALRFLLETVWESPQNNTRERLLQLAGEYRLRVTGNQS